MFKKTKIDWFNHLISICNWTNWKLIPFYWKMIYWENIKPLFVPQNKKIRKAVTRSWKDITSLIVDVNFAMIKQFYEDEYLEGWVDWEGTSKDHADFAGWLEEAYKYITIERVELEKKRDNAYPPARRLDEMFVETKDDNGTKMYTFVPGPGTYEELYGEVNAYESLISDRDTELLIEMIKKREYFWT